MIHRHYSSFLPFQFLPFSYSIILFTFFIILSIFYFQFVNGADFYITNPWEATKWKAGTTVTITWKLYPSVNSVINGINLDLLDGPDLSARVLQNIAFSLPIDSTSFSWNILPDLPSSSHVFIRITGTGPEPVYRFSHRFEIYGGGSEWNEASNITKFMDPHLATEIVSQPLNIFSSITKLPPVVTLWNADGEAISTETLISTSKKTGNILGNEQDQSVNNGNIKSIHKFLLQEILVFIIPIIVTMTVLMI